MREILFRGKSNDKWRQGGLLYDEENNKAFIAEHFEDKAAYFYEVIPETVGQYTGLTDKNGKRIFEGDIIKSREYGDTYSVKYFADVDYPAFDCEPEIEGCECNGLSYLMNTDFVEVIGNIHDNPELLKGE